MFHVLHVIYHSEPELEGDPPVENEAFVFFQDRLPIAPSSELEILGRFRSAMGDDLKDGDAVAYFGEVVDPLTLRVLKAWDRTAIDGPAGQFNLGTP